MIYLYEVKNKKGAFQIYGLAVLLPLISVAVWFLTDSLVTTIICLLIGLALSYYLLKTARKLTSGKIITHDEGFKAYAPGNEIFSFNWNEITHAGRIVKEGAQDRFFVYAEEKDSILKISQNYKNMDDLVTEIKEHTPFKDYILQADETIEDVIKKELGIQKD